MSVKDSPSKALFERGVAMFSGLGGSNIFDITPILEALKTGKAFPKRHISYPTIEDFLKTHEDFYGRIEKDVTDVKNKTQGKVSLIK